MANHASALKAHRQSLRRRTRNRSNKSTLRTVLKSFVEKTNSEKPADLRAELASLYSEVDKAARKGAMSKNAAARQKSRLTRRMNAAATAASKA
jgi:small subunit ribosomal protein S20